MRARDYTLYLYLIVKDLKRAFKSLFYYNITTILRYRVLILNNLYSLYIIIIALLRILRREANSEKFIYLIIESKINSDNAKGSYLAIYKYLRETIT